MVKLLQQRKPATWNRFMLVLIILCSSHNHQHIRSVAAARPLSWSRIRRSIPFLPYHRKNYTPLVFFTVPKGVSPICDEMERVVGQIEAECHVTVERLDVLRHPENEAVLTMVTNSIRTASPTTASDPSMNILQAQPPLLYHRESRQVYQVLLPTSSSSAVAATAPLPYVDPDRIRAWAKGRYLSPFIGGSRRSQDDAPRPNPQRSPVVVNPDNDQEVEQLLDEMALSPEQLKGKRLMEERTRAKATTKTTK